MKFYFCDSEETKQYFLVILEKLPRNDTYSISNGENITWHFEIQNFSVYKYHSNCID